jgi:hypothetical protein
MSWLAIAELTQADFPAAPAVLISGGLPQDSGLDSSIKNGLV